MVATTVILNLPASSYPQRYVNSESGRCVVAGSARCLWDDLAKVEGEFAVIAVNDAILHFPRFVKHAYSNENRYLDKWCAARRDQFVKRWGPVELTHSNHVGGDVTWPWPGNGTSSLGAVYTALALGYDEVILCGVPLDDSGHYFDPPGVHTNFCAEVPEKNGSLKYWRDAVKAFEGKVRSMSGRSKELLDAARRG